MFYVKLDENGYYSGSYAYEDYPQENWDKVESLPADEQVYQTCYQLIDGEWVLDEAKKAALKEKIENLVAEPTMEERILMLEQENAELKESNLTIMEALAEVYESMVI